MEVNSVQNLSFKGGIQSKGFIKAVRKQGGKLAETLDACQKLYERLGVDVFVTPPSIKPVEDGAAIIAGKTPVWYKSIFTKLSFKYDSSAPEHLRGKFADKMFRLNLSGGNIGVPGGYYTERAQVGSTSKYPKIEELLRYIKENAQYIGINKKAGVYYTRGKMPRVTSYKNDFGYSPEEVKNIITHENIRLFEESKDYTPSKIPFITGDTGLFSGKYGTEPVVLHWLDKGKDPGVRIRYGHDYANCLSESISYTSPETQLIYQQTKDGKTIGYVEPFNRCESFIDD